MLASIVLSQCLSALELFVAKLAPWWVLDSALRVVGLPFGRGQLLPAVFAFLGLAVELLVSLHVLLRAFIGAVFTLHDLLVLIEFFEVDAAHLLCQPFYFFLQPGDFTVLP